MLQVALFGAGQFRGRHAVSQELRQFFVDRGGTFTDVVACAPDGTQIVKKLLSESPGRYEDAALEAIRQTLAEHCAKFADVGQVRIGTTIATNALLERKGSKTVLVITEGFGDALEIGVQARPEIFALHIVKPDLLHTRVIEARERVTAEGEVTTPLDEAHAQEQLKKAYADGYRAAAIACRRLTSPRGAPRRIPASSTTRSGSPPSIWRRSRWSAACAPRSPSSGRRRGRGSSTCRRTRPSGSRRA